MPVMGIETEYGILAPEDPDVPAGILAAAVVRHYPGPATATRLDWPDDIGIEDAHNRILGNGARLYVDHAHPEYSGPEVTSAIDAVAYDQAGDEAVAAGAAAASDRLGIDVRVFKNNTDGHGASYGCHENYLLDRATPWARIVQRLTPFLVSRSVVIGAGRVGLGQRGEAAGFQLSQRADFIETEVGLDTTRRRPIVNTRDEPHAPAARYRRLHVITGDANRSSWSTWLKVGSAAAVLAAIADDAVPDLALADPVSAFHEVSRDLSLRRPLRLYDGRRFTALDLQQAYAEAVAAHQDERGGDVEVVQAWHEVLDDLAADPVRCADRLDWVAKHRLLAAYADRHDLTWGSPRLAQLDLAWADLDDARSPFAALRRAGRLRPRVDAARAQAALGTPPPDTRAWLRGTLVGRFPDAVDAADWEWLLLRDSAGRRHRIDLAEPLRHTRGESAPVLAAATTVDAVCRRLAH